MDIFMKRRTKSIREQREIPSYDLKVKALFDFWSFVDLIQFRGGKKNFAECHYKLLEWADTHNKDRELVLMPRGHLKSTLMSVARKLWRIYQNPNVRIYVGTATRFLATAFVRQIKQYLEDPFLQEHVWNDRPHIEGRLIPLMDRAARSRRNDLGENTESQDKKIVWRADAIQVIRPDIMSEPTVMVGSVGSTATGFHYDEMVLDDVITYENINTPEKRESQMSWIYDLESVLDPPVFDEGLHKQLKDVIVRWKNTCRVPSALVTEYTKRAKKFSYVGGKLSVIGTRYDLDDYYGLIQENSEELSFAVYSCNIYVNGSDNSAGYIWPEKWDEELEQRTRKTMTAQRFSSQYLNQILARENQVLVFDNIIPVHPAWVRLKNRYVHIMHTKDRPEGESIIKPYLVIDPAASDAEKADFTAIAVGGRDKFGNLFILDLDVGHYTALEILEHTYALADKWTINAIHVEVVGGFKHLLEFFRTNFSKYRPIGLIEYRPQGDKILRIGNQLQPLIQNRMMFMMAYLKNNRTIENAFNFFPRKSVKDDPPDVCAILAEISKAPVDKGVVNRLLEFNKLWGGTR